MPSHSTQIDPAKPTPAQIQAGERKRFVDKTKRDVKKVMLKLLVSGLREIATNFSAADIEVVGFGVEPRDVSLNSFRVLGGVRRVGEQTIFQDREVQGQIVFEVKVGSVMMTLPTGFHLHPDDIGTPLEQIGIGRIADDLEYTSSLRHSFYKPTVRYFDSEGKMREADINNGIELGSFLIEQRAAGSVTTASVMLTSPAIPLQPASSIAGEITASGLATMAQLQLLHPGRTARAEGRTQ